MRFSKGDIVISGDGFSIGVVEVGNDGESEADWNYCKVKWADGDYTTCETYNCMSHHKIIPEEWTPELIITYLDILCP